PRRRRRSRPARGAAQRRGRDRGRRPRRRPARRARDRHRDGRLGRGGRAARGARRLLARGDGRLMARFRQALARPGLAAIAEVKRRSPSAGDLRPDADPARLAAAFADGGAAAISILVDARFAGTLDDLRAARAATSAPLLAKGFFRELEELRELKDAGADCALLILHDLRTAQLMTYARALGLDTLVEAHDERELERAVALGADPIGINARDLSTFEIDRRKQLELVAKAPRDRIVIAESAVQSRAQGTAAELAGADAILVGSALMRASDPVAKLSELISRPLVKVCGLTREEDVAVAAEA